MKIGITRFPGTNCDEDIWQFAKVRGHQPQWLWHQDRFQASQLEAVIVPGGFSYGDYLRCGALAAKSPVMEGVREVAAAGKPVLGICNGFQILCESGLLPGVLTRNESRRFIDDWTELEVVTANPTFTGGKKVGDRLKLPIAHGEGRFLAEEKEMKRLQDGGQIWLRYIKNPNGSLQDIAGVLNEKKNVAGLMPHPERALFDWMGGIDGGFFL